MPYSDINDLKDRTDEADIISLTDDGDLGVVDTDITDAAIAWADAKINAYLGKRYGVPLDPVPEIVNGLSVDIAVYRLYQRRGRTSDAVRNDYLDAMKFLRDIADGKAELDGIVEATPENTPDTVTITTSPRIFSRSKMEGF